MTSIRTCILIASVVGGGLLRADPPRPDTPTGDNWSKNLKDRTQRGTLQNAFQRVRGDSGRWNDNARLQHAPPLTRKPANMSLDDWYDRLERTRRRPLTRADENWLLFQTQQRDDNDRVWIERIERQGNRFTVIMHQAIWQGPYSKNFTYYNVYGINLGKLKPGSYEAKWIIKPFTFQEFEGTGRPREKQTEHWPKEAHPRSRNSAKWQRSSASSGNESRDCNLMVSQSRRL